MSFETGTVRSGDESVQNVLGGVQVRVVSKARNYSWREWTDEQMNTPGLLALSDDAPSYMVKRPDEKARWVRRMTDPAWYRDWSSDKLVWEGEFGPGVTMWVQDHPFMQGIEALVPSWATKPYEPGCRGFALALSDLDQAQNLVQKLRACSPTDKT